MQEEHKFYSVLDGLDHLEPGKKMVISHSLNFSSYHADLSPLVGRSEKELSAMRNDSMSAERDIYKKLREATVEWAEQGAQTLLLDKALEYVRTPEVAHTSNEWKHGEGGTWTISNRTYVMWYRIVEESPGGGCRVYWGLDYNVPRQPESGPCSCQFTGSSIEIAGQHKKWYTNQDTAQKYIQGRFDLYAHLFTELSPPVPEKVKRMFSVNGHLLPGYTLKAELPMEPDKNAVADLLSCLGDEDIGRTEAPEAQPQEPPPQASPAKTPVPKQSTQPKQKKSAPMR